MEKPYPVSGDSETAELSIPKNFSFYSGPKKAGQRLFFVMPAKAGIQGLYAGAHLCVRSCAGQTRRSAPTGIPVFTGMTAF